MSDYAAPIQDMLFVLRELAGLDEITKLAGSELSLELVEQILTENARFSAEVLAPLNAPGDREGSTWREGDVRTPKGFKEAYRQFVEGGWNALQFPVDFGGQGLPKIVAAPVMEMWKSANLSFSLCPLLTGGAIEALLLRGSAAQQRIFLPRMVAGRRRAPISRPSRPRRCRKAITIESSARRSSSPTASTTWRRTSFISCSHALPMPRQGCEESRCSSCPSSSSTPTARSAGAMTCAASRSSTSSGSTRVRPQCWRTATRTARSGTWSGRRTGASSTCSS